MKREAFESAVPAAAVDDDGAAARKPLRLLTAGSVDDGKSTLIGRLLLDGRALLADQLDALHARAGGGAPDLSLVTDGLEAEREQGITIDVAYRYFATRARKFVIADAPGHEQYTRNMVTAAAGSDAAVVLVDVTKLGLDDDADALPTLLVQTHRHALLARLLRVAHLVFAVNKLDAVAEPACAFARVRASIEAFAAKAGIAPAGIVPISALRGDNVSLPSTFVAGYDGPTLLALLERLPADDDAQANAPAALPVQYVDAPSGRAGGTRARVLWGRIARGRIAVGDELVVWPGGRRGRVAELHRPTFGAASTPAAQAHVERPRVDASSPTADPGRGDRPPPDPSSPTADPRHVDRPRPAPRTIDGIAAGRSAGVVFDRPLDVSRGDWLAAPDSLAPADAFRATLAWLDDEPAVVGRKYVVRHGHRWVAARIAAIEHRLDVATLAPVAAGALAANDLGTVEVELQEALPLAPFARDKTAGALVVVDPATNRTSGVLLVA